jgi:hypothetical protein
MRFRACAGALQLAGTMAVAGQDDDITVSQCLQIMLAAAKGARQMVHGADAVVSLLHDTLGKGQLHTRIAAAQDATTAAVGLELLSELSRGDASARVAVSMLHARCAAAGLPLVDDILRSVAPACYSAHDTPPSDADAFFRRAFAVAPCTSSWSHGARTGPPG